MRRLSLMACDHNNSNMGPFSFKMGLVDLGNRPFVV